MTTKPLSKQEARALIQVLREVFMTANEKDYFRHRVHMEMPLNEYLPDDFGSAQDLAGYIVKIIKDNDADPLATMIKLVKIHDDEESIGMSVPELEKCVKQFMGEKNEETKH